MRNVILNHLIMNTPHYLLWLGIYLRFEGWTILLRMVSDPISNMLLPAPCHCHELSLDPTDLFLLCDDDLPCFIKFNKLNFCLTKLLIIFQYLTLICLLNSCDIIISMMGGDSQSFNCCKDHLKIINPNAPFWFSSQLFPQIYHHDPLLLWLIDLLHISKTR